jgi:hypothetical protein
MARKTVELAYIVERGNYFLKHSEDEQREQRLGVCSMVELALHKANAYGGYSHLESAGIPWHLQGQPFSYINKRDEFGNPVDAHVRIMPADDNDSFARFIAWAISDGGWRNALGQRFVIDDTRRAYSIKGAPLSASARLRASLEC